MWCSWGRKSASDEALAGMRKGRNPPRGGYVGGRAIVSVVQNRSNSRSFSGRADADSDIRGSSSFGAQRNQPRVRDHSSTSTPRAGRRSIQAPNVSVSAFRARWRWCIRPGTIILAQSAYPWMKRGGGANGYAISAAVLNGRTKRGGYPSGIVRATPGSIRRMGAMANVVVSVAVCQSRGYYMRFDIGNADPRVSSIANLIRLVARAWLRIRFQIRDRRRHRRWSVDEFHGFRLARSRRRFSIRRYSTTEFCFVPRPFSIRRALGARREDEIRRSRLVLAAAAFGLSRRTSTATRSSDVFAPRRAALNSRAPRYDGARNLAPVRGRRFDVVVYQRRFSPS